MPISLKTKFVLLIALFVFSFSYTQTLTQTVKGKVLDAETGAPLLGANVIVLNVNQPKGAITDEAGYFRIEEIDVGRASFQFTYLYKTFQ